MYELITGVVISWKKLWRTIGFPTANISLKEGIIDEWTYKINIIIDDKIYSWVWVYLKSTGLFESHIFDFSSDLYAKNISVRILDKIRENTKFESFEDLKKQIQKDVETAKSEINYVLTFWTFDIFHEWHKKFLFDARTYGDRLITVVSTNNNVVKFKWEKPLYDQLKRVFDVASSKIPYEVLLWDTLSPMDYVKKYKPKVICLGYDQVWFSNMLDDFLKSENIDAKVVRLDSFKPEIYKSSILKKNF